MYIFISALFLEYAIFQAYIEKKAYNPLTIFLVVWAIICFLPGLHLFGLYDFNEDGYIIVLVGVLGFCVGYILMRNTKKTIVFGKLSNAVEYQFREKMFLRCTMGLFLCYLMLAVRVTLAINVMGYHYADIRTIYLRGTDVEKQLLIYGSGMIQSIEYFIFRPMFFCALAVTIARFFKKLRFDLQTVLMLATVAFYVMINFGRVILFEVVGCTLICAFVTGIKLTDRQKKTLKKVLLRYVVPGIVIVLVVMNYISGSRKSQYSNATSIWEELYAYFAIPVPLMSHWLPEIDRTGDTTYGLMFVKGFVNFIMIFLGKIGITSSFFTHAGEIVNNTETFVALFPSHTYNAYVSMFYYFYVDWRLPGVFVGSVIYGGIFGYMFRQLVNNFKEIPLINMSIFLLIFESFMKCFVRWEFIQMTYCISFLWILIWFKREQ